MIARISSGYWSISPKLDFAGLPVRRDLVMVAALCVPVAKKKVSHFALSVKIFLVKYGVKGHLLKKK